MFRLTLLLVIILTAYGCIKNPPPTVLKGVELNGINGTAYYYFNTETGAVSLVVKKEHANNLEYNAEIIRDTISLGEDFKARFCAHTNEYHVYIEEPQADTIIGNHRPKESPYMYEFESYTYKPLEAGTYTLKGRLKYDTTAVPFEYKFIVLPKD